jgi:hypothetical protein
MGSRAAVCNDSESPRWDRRFSPPVIGVTRRSHRTDEYYYAQYLSNAQPRNVLNMYLVDAIDAIFEEQRNILSSNLELRHVLP